MSLYNAMNKTSRTANGALTLNTSTDALVDLFFQAGASRGKDITSVFQRAYATESDLALRTLLWLRDVRGGAGERQQFRNLVVQLTEKDQARVMDKIPELGRWDDMLVFVGTKLQAAAFSRIQDALHAGNGLCAKWMPRKGDVAVALRKFLGFSPKEYRKTLVNLSKTVETSMCAGDWSGIEYGKVPSIAAARYQAAFSKHDETGYAGYRDALVKGEAKINAGAIFPHDIIHSMAKGDKDIANAQWNALPDYLEGSEERILPVVDTSGSMGRFGSGVASSPIHVAIALGLYISQRNEGTFKDQFITFSDTPTMQKVTGTLAQRVNQMSKADWSMNTNFMQTFRVILEAGRRDGLTQEQMPTKVLVLSDMEFDRATDNRSWGDPVEQTNFEVLDELYQRAGYKRPQVIFWNLNGRDGNCPISAGEAGTALVSGFSPSIMTSLLGGEDFSPRGIMLKTICKDRYSF